MKCAPSKHDRLLKTVVITQAFSLLFNAASADAQAIDNQCRWQTKVAPSVNAQAASGHWYVELDDAPLSGEAVSTAKVAAAASPEAAAAEATASPPPQTEATAGPAPAAGAESENESKPASKNESAGAPTADGGNFTAPAVVAPVAPVAAAPAAPANNSSLPAVAMLEGSAHTEVTSTADGPPIIDNDEAAAVKSTIEYKELPTDEGKTRVKAGAQFPVVISSQITSKSAKEGDAVEARLKYDLKIGDRMVAPKGSVVVGHINYCLKARSAMHSLISPERWYRNSGCLGLAFDEIINDKGEHIPLVATPARQARIVKNKAEGRELGVNHNGQVTGPWSQQLRYKAIRIGLNAAMAPAGVFSFGAMPVALGVIGAANPSFAFMKPVGQNVRHRRIKGFVWGAFSGLPGSWIIEDTVIKGQEAVIKPGDEFLAEFKEEFTGEPESEASLIPSAATKVKGQVLPGKKP